MKVKRIISLIKSLDESDLSYLLKVLQEETFFAPFKNEADLF